MNIKSEFNKFSNSKLNIPTSLLEDYEKHTNKKISDHLLNIKNNSTTETPTNLTPYVLEERQMNVTAIDVFSRMMKDRIIFLGEDVNSYTANVIVAQLLFLENLNPDQDIQFYINSPGGSVYDGLGIYDTMNYIKPRVNTLCIGMAASMGAVLLTAGAEGGRAALPHSRVMIHQPLGGARGQESDIAITAKQIAILKTELYEILATRSGNSMEDIDKWCDRDYWMIADEAKEKGFIDQVIRRTNNS